MLASVPHDAKLRPSYDLIDHDVSLLERWPELDVRPKNWTSKKGVSRALNVSDST